MVMVAGVGQGSPPRPQKANPDPRGTNSGTRSDCTSPFAHPSALARYPTSPPSSSTSAIPLATLAGAAPDSIWHAILLSSTVKGSQLWQFPKFLKAFSDPMPWPIQAPHPLHRGPVYISCSECHLSGITLVCHSNTVQCGYKGSKLATYVQASLHLTTDIVYHQPTFATLESTIVAFVCAYLSLVAPSTILDHHHVVRWIW
jgi:hypothetical protein